MRRKRLPLLFSLSLLLTVFCFPTIARADDNDGDDYDVKARVVRISLIHGDVSFKRHETEDWETARVNTPLVEGDTISTGNNARAEIQIDARNFLRLSSDSVLRIVTLRDEGIALSLAEGTATLRLARFDRDKEYFEIDAPKTTIAAESNGVYRISAARKGNIQLTVRDGGRARIYSDTAGFTVKSEHSATLTYEGDEAGDWQTANAAARDSWDEWVSDRESYLASRLKYEQNMRYYDSDIWGAEDLDAYGSWAYANDYGWIWRPSITIVNNYNDWAPYRFGSWIWCPPYGWTWVGDEPWGWAPYHYGRWVYYNNYWAWCPHAYYRSHHSWWRPALVAFLSIDFNFGSHYCWYPLSYHHRDPRSTYFHHDRERLRPLRGDELASLRRVNPAYLRALTTVPARDFGNGRGQAASGDLARRVIDAQPLRGDLPLRPAANAGNNRGDNRVARPASDAVLRPTGATTRTPGVSLDSELRRSRIFNGREPVVTPTANAARTPETRPTG
ncbi:MAG: FecR family protein, partial [Acidobacteriota bacterium]|nr:FecR family protein [Acidobacteriota bacterium]